MAKKKNKKVSKLSLFSSKVKSIGLTVKSYAVKNHLALVNLAVTGLILYKVVKLDEKLLKVYIGLAEGIGLNVMLIMELAARLLGLHGA